VNLTSIEWATHCHNIMTGCLNRELGICNVDACYARQTAENPFYRKAFPYGFKPHFYEGRIHQVAKLRTPAIIFMDSMSDTFGSWWTDEEILKVLHIMDNYRGVHWHKYVVLTKNPARMAVILSDYVPRNYLENVYFGTSVSGDVREAGRILSLQVTHGLGFKTVLSMEPLLNDPTRMLDAAGNINWLDWLIIGGQTKPTIEPKIEWLMEIGRVVDHQPVFIKKNAGLCDQTWLTKQFPADLLPIAKAWGKA